MYIFSLFVKYSPVKVDNVHVKMREKQDFPLIVKNYNRKLQKDASRYYIINHLIFLSLNAFFKKYHYFFYLHTLSFGWVAKSKTIFCCDRQIFFLIFQFIPLIPYIFRNSKFYVLWIFLLLNFSWSFSVHLSS